MPRVTRRHSLADFSGFTLLEIMVATAILAIIATTVYGVLWRTLEGKDHAEQRAELFSAGREAVMRMADEIERALPPSGGIASTIWFIGVAGKDAVPNDAVGFVMDVRRDLSSGERRGGRAGVSYQLQPTEVANNFILVRHEEMMRDPAEELLGSDQSGAEEAPTPPQMDTALVDGVAGFRLRYLEPQTGEWVNSWDTTEEVKPGELPRGLPPIVEIQLFLFDNSGSYVDFSTRVDLPLFVPPVTPAPAQG